MTDSAKAREPKPRIRCYSCGKFVAWPMLVCYSCVRDEERQLRNDLMWGI